MKSQQVRQALTTPLTSPAYAASVPRFTDREYLNIVYRTDHDALRAVVPEPLEIDDPLVRFEVMRMNDVSSFGPYTETGQAIPVRFGAERGEYLHAMYLDNFPATATMGYKHQPLDPERAKAQITVPTYMLKIVPGYDRSPRVCELVRTEITDITVKQAWTGPARLQLFEHVLAPLADLPVREIVSASHVLTDLTLGPVSPIHDYLAER